MKRLRHNLRGAAIEQVLIASAVLTTLVIVVAKLGIQMDTTNIFGRDASIVVNLRNRISAANTDVIAWVDKMRRSNPGPNYWIETCMPDETTVRYSTGPILCPPVISGGNLDPKISNGSGSVSIIDIYDSEGNRIAAAFNPNQAEGPTNYPIYYDPSGRDITQNCALGGFVQGNRHFDCRFRAEGYMVRENAAVQASMISDGGTPPLSVPNPAAGPGNVKFVVRITANPNAGQSATGADGGFAPPKFKTVYENIQVGMAWKFSTIRPCDVGTLRVDYFNPTAAEIAGETKTLNSIDVSREPVCANPFANDCSGRSPPGASRGLCHRCERRAPGRLQKNPRV